MNDYEQLKLYFETALKCRTTNHEKIGKLLSTKNYTMYNNVFFKITPAFRKARNDYIKATIKKYGLVLISETEIGDLLHRHAAELKNKNSIKDQIKLLNSELTTITQSELVYIKPNYALKLMPQVQSFSIGPIQCIRTKDIDKEKLKISPKLLISDKPKDSKIIISGDNTAMQAALSAECFVVSVRASKKSSPSHVNWLLDVGISLFRLYCFKAQMTYGIFPYIGEVDPLLFEPREMENNELIIDTKKGITSWGGGSLPKVYQVDLPLKEWLDKSDFSLVCNTIYNYKEGYVSERVNRALGWMTRARRSEDMAQRFLFFFTALEALFSDNDKNAPITDTIARNIASIISKQKSRHEVAKRVKDLYAIRSQLVHSGKREVSSADCNQIQYYAEIVCLQLMDKALNMKNNDFIDGLKKASYGTKWPPTSSKTK